MLNRPRKAAVASESLAALFDAFLEWTKKNRPAGTYERKDDRLQWLLRFTPADGIFRVSELRSSELKPFHVQCWIDSKDCSDGHQRGCMSSVQRSMSWARTITRRDVRPMVSLLEAVDEDGSRLTHSRFRPIAPRLQRSETIPKRSRVTSVQQRVS